MAGQTKDDRTPVEKFEAYNPYAERAAVELEQGAPESAAVNGQLAVAFALDRLRAEIHFANKGRS